MGKFIQSCFHPSPSNNWSFSQAVSITQETKPVKSGLHYRLRGHTGRITQGSGVLRRRPCLNMSNLG